MKIVKVVKRDLRSLCSNSNIFISAVLELTSKCNFHCIHCFQNINTNEKTFEETKTLIDKLHDMGIIYITLTGGEAFLSKHFEKTYLYLKKKGFLITIYTNGSGLLRYSNIITKYKPLNIAISIYGLSEKEYKNFTRMSNQFDKVKKTLQFLKKTHINFELRTLVTKLNYSKVMLGLYDDFAFIYGKHMFYSHSIIPTKLGDITPYIYRISEDEATSFLVWQAKKGKHSYEYDKIIEKSPTPFFCTAGISSIHINYDFQISICIKDINVDFDYKIQKNKLTDELKNRGKIIRKNAKQLQCSKCNKNYRCEWCPIDFEYSGISVKNEYNCNIQDRLIEQFNKV